VSEQQELPPLPPVEEVLLSTAVSLVNLAGIRLTEKDQRDVGEAKAAIDAARALLPLCPQDGIAPIKDALAQLQMLYVKEAGVPAPGEGQGEGEGGTPAQGGQSDPDAEERAKARAKIWTPGKQ
jgi:hypothetical protein